MARGGVDFEGIRRSCVTYAADDSIKTLAGSDNRAAVVDKAVTITGDGTVGFGVDGDPLLGAIYQYEYDGYVSVQDTGYVIVPGVAGSLPAPGDVVVVNGSGAVKTAVGVTYGPTCVSVDATNNLVTVRL